MRRERKRWWRVVIRWTLDSQDADGGERYAFVTKDTEQIAIFAALNALIVEHTVAVGDTVQVLSCDPHAYQRKHDELEEVP